MKSVTKYCEKHQITQTEFAKRIRVGKGHMSRILSGERQPSLGVLQRMAAKLDKTVDELMKELPDKVT
jgi:transcriptional regulator with XRE-family HTH domain